MWGDVMRLTRRKINIEYKNKRVATNVVLYMRKNKKQNKYLFFIRMDFFNRYIRFIINKPFEENEKYKTIENKEFRLFLNEIVKDDKFQDLIQIMQKYFTRNKGL